MDDLSVGVRRLVRTVLGMAEADVRPAPWNGDAGHQAGPYATVMIMDPDEIGRASRSTISDGAGGLLSAVEVPLKFTASVQFFKAAPRPGFLRGAPVSAVAADYHGVVAGGFDVTIDGTLRKVAGLNFSTAADMPAIATIAQAALAALATGTTCIWTGKRFIVSSPTTGQTSAVGFAAPPTSAGPPANVATLLGLTAAAGAVKKDNATGIAGFNMDAVDQARRLVLLLQLPQNAALMRTMGLGYIRPSTVRNLAALTDATWESRSSVDLTFNVIQRETVPVNSIESAVVSVSAQMGGATLTAQKEVTP